MDEMPSDGDPRSEIVVLVGVLPHAVNQGWHGANDVVVEAVNGEAISSLADLVQKIQSSTDSLISFNLPKGYRIVLDREAALAASAEIARTYRIPTDRSDDLK
jgi:hypothetical protein